MQTFSVSEIVPNSAARQTKRNPWKRISNAVDRYVMFSIEYTLSIDELNPLVFNSSLETHDFGGLKQQRRVKPKLVQKENTKGGKKMKVAPEKTKGDKKMKIAPEKTKGDSYKAKAADTTDQTTPNPKKR